LTGVLPIKPLEERPTKCGLDVIAQTGKYAPGERDLRKFVVEGEQHYWVHVTIDRFNGRVLDKQNEVVNE
jgi:hypothetical protein